MRKKVKYLIDLERSLYPDVWKINKNYTNIDGDEPKPGEDKYLSDYDMLIMDDELDPYNVNISSEGMHIDTKDYAHISLTKRHLKLLYDAMDKFNVEYEEDYKNWSDALNEMNSHE